GCLPRSCSSYRLIFVVSRTNATVLPATRAPRTASAPRGRHGRREPLGEEPLDVLEELFGLVPAIEDTDSRRALAARVRGDDHRHRGSSGASRIRRAEGLRDRIRAVENREVDLRLDDRLRQPLGRRELLDLEVATAEQEPCKPEKSWIAARHEHVGTRLVVL